MSASRFMLTWIAQKYGAMELKTFRAEFPHHCLVWEPGEWRPPSKSGSTVVSGQESSRAPGSKGLDALAILLKARPDQAPLVVGRDPQCDVTVDDATISARHLQLLQKGDQWFARNPGSTNGSWLNSQPMPRETEVPLTPSDHIRLGQVSLTYYDPKGLFFRLKAR